MHKCKEAHFTLDNLFWWVSVLWAIIPDNALELTEGEFKRKAQQVQAAILPVEAYTPNDNLCKAGIRELKWLFWEVMNATNTSEVLWDLFLSTVHSFGLILPWTSMIDLGPICTKKHSLTYLNMPNSIASWSISSGQAPWIPWPLCRPNWMGYHTFWMYCCKIAFKPTKSYASMSFGTICAVLCNQLFVARSHFFVGTVQYQKKLATPNPWDK